MAESGEGRMQQAIYPAEVSDIPAIEQLRHEVWRATFPQVAPDHITVGDVDLIFADLTQGIERGEKALDDPAVGIFVAKQAETLDGFVIAKKQDNQKREIASLYVAPELHGGGIGSALLNTAMAWLEAEEYPIYLETISTNYPAIKFYEKRGFVKSADIPFEQPKPPLKYIPHIAMVRQPASIV